MVQLRQSAIVLAVGRGCSIDLEDHRDLSEEHALALRLALPRRPLMRGNTEVNNTVSNEVHGVRVGILLQYGVFRRKQLRLDIIDKELYTVDIDQTDISVDILRSNEQCECIKVLEEFIDEIGLDNKKVDNIKSLIWINMAPLHKKPISDFLFHFGKYNLYLNT